VNQEGITSVKMGDDRNSWLEQQAEENHVSVSEILRRCVDAARMNELLQRPIIIQSQSGESFTADLHKLSRTAWECRALVRDLKSVAVKQSDSDLRVSCYALLKTLLPICQELARLSKLVGCLDEETLEEVFWVYRAFDFQRKKATTEEKKEFAAKVMDAIRALSS
jgi:hypothetical protein